MSLTARVATREDYPVVARLFGELAVPDSPPTAEQFVGGMLPRVLVVCDGDGPVAYAFWQVYGALAHVVHVVVDPRARRRGVGRELLEQVRARVRDEGCAQWSLNVKTDNVPAQRLYANAGFSEERRSVAMAIRWAEVARLPACPTATLVAPGPDDESEISARFGLPRERLSLLRARPHVVFVALREGERIVAFASFDPTFPGAFPFCAERPILARPLLDGLRAHARDDRFDYVRITVEGDAQLAEVLRGAGAETTFELMRMSGAV